MEVFKKASEFFQGTAPKIENSFNPAERIREGNELNLADANVAGFNPDIRIPDNTERAYYDDNGQLYRTGNEVATNKEIEKNGYLFKTDEKGRTISAEGKLQLRDHEGRNPMEDSRDVVGHGEMKDSDDRGHLIGDQFNGSGDLLNLVPMDSTLNKGDYKKLENTLADALKDGADVRVKIEPVYEGDSHRPSKINFSYDIDGEKEVVVFKNGGME